MRKRATKDSYVCAYAFQSGIGKSVYRYQVAVRVRFPGREKHPPEVPLALLHEHRTDYAGVLAVFSCTMKVSVYSRHDVTSPTPRATHRSSLCAAFTAR